MPGIYTGIGSRQLPQSILNMMSTLGKKLAGRGYKLRTGDATGADRAFAMGADAGKGDKNIQEVLDLFAPLGDARALPSSIMAARKTPPKEGAIFEQLLKLVEEFHPLKPKGKSVATSPKFRYQFRNPLQLFGEGMNKPSDFVLAGVNPRYFHTKNARDLGGTGQNLRIAMAKDIPHIILNPEYPPNKRMAFLKRLNKSNPDIDWEAMFEFLSNQSG